MPELEKTCCFVCELAEKAKKHRISKKLFGFCLMKDLQVSFFTTELLMDFPEARLSLAHDNNVSVSWYGINLQVVLWRLSKQKLSHFSFVDYFL